jgi:hypothetical protein
MSPPDPEMRRGAVGTGTPKSQQQSLNTAETNQSELDLQALKLRQRFLLAYETVRAIATLAYGVAR